MFTDVVIELSELLDSQKEWMTKDGILLPTPLDLNTGHLENPINLIDVDEDYSGVYFFRESFLGLIKIGHAANIKHRWQSMQSHMPQRLDMIAFIQLRDKDTRMEVEKEIHSVWGKYRFRGEWFALQYYDMKKIIEIYSEMYESVKIWPDLE